ncbi:cytochrome P450 [Suillus ampliporus]|nr:cytochrome P450 [Suillus ampliporus]
MIVSGLSLETLAILVGSVAALRAFQVFLDYWRLLGRIHYLPGYRTILDPKAVIANVLPPTPWLNLGRDHTWLLKHTPFAKRGLDLISCLSWWPKARVSLLIADVNTIKEIVWSRGGRFPKPLHQYALITVFGGNIVASEGDEWKRHHKVVAPAFSEANNRLVLEVTTQIMLELFDTVWAGQDEVVVNHAVDLTMPIALFVISAAGFGRTISWKEDAMVPLGHKLTFKDALHTVAQNLIIKTLIPRWAMGLTKRFRHIRLAFDELHLYLTETIQERQKFQHKEDNDDLLSNLLRANEKLSKGEVKLSDSELIGNIFIFFVGGHETTAHALTFALALLALHPDKQEELYQHINRVLPDGRIPTYDDMPSLSYSSAVFNEALRMFPLQISAVPKLNAEDTTFTLTDVNGAPQTVSVPEGVTLTLDIPGLHYNPKYWEDPYTFKPERFLGDWNRDAFLPFSGGYRACTGRKFAETEATAVLTILLSRYTISIKDEPQFAGETYEQRKARILNAHSRLTLAPTRLPLVFKRRT